MEDDEAFWEDEKMDGVLVREQPGPEKVYELVARTARFGEAIVLSSKRIPCTPVNNRLIDQLVGAGTSVGANYCEANEGYSPKDSRHRLTFCCKEAKESKFFLRMIATAEPDLKSDARVLWREAHELHLIFCAILHTKRRSA